jgi:hypothetical protein
MVGPVFQALAGTITNFFLCGLVYILHLSDGLHISNEGSKSHKPQNSQYIYSNLIYYQSIDGSSIRIGMSNHVLSS